MINKRIFGSDIPDKIKKKLEIRQAFAQSANPGESLDDINEKYKDIDGVGLDNDFDNQADLSSRTPFVRMWTAVEVFSKEISDLSEKVFTIPRDAGTGEILKNIAKNAADEYKKKNEKNGISKNAIYYDENNGSPRYIIKSKKIIEERESYGKRIYVVGNHTLNTLTSEPNESVNTSTVNDNDELLSGVKNSDVLPNEHTVNKDNNAYMKPPAGITGFSSTTEGPLGVMRKTTVNFTVHNFHDFESIYQRYFLRPAAQIFVDFGWNAKVLYDPKTLVFDKKKNDFEASVEEILYGEKGDVRVDENGKKITETLQFDGYITEAQGDLDTVLGYVTNYDAKVLENGSVECSVEITSKNIALLSEKFDNAGKRQKRIEHQLTIGVLYDGLIAGSSPLDRVFIDKQLMSLKPKTESEFATGILSNARKNLQFDDLNLTKANIVTGVGVSDIGDSNIYISIGYLEDKILNPEFGVGSDDKNINTGVDTQIRMDSSESFTTYMNDLYIRQKVMGKSDEMNPSFLYPETWDTTFSTSTNKTPTTYLSGSIDYSNSKTTYDKKHNRIPIRELFVKADTVKSALAKDNVVDVLKEILVTMNDDSGDVFKLSIANTGPDNIVSIVDTNFVPYERGIEEESQAFDNLFEFSVMSPNSIVKGYDLGFNMPEGGIANMIGIQGMGSSRGSQIFPINSLVDEGLVLETLNSLRLLPEDEQKLHKFNTMGVGYFPDMGSYKSDKFTSDTKIDQRVAYGYSRTDEILDKNYNIPNAFDIDYSYFNAEVPKDRDDGDVDDITPEEHDEILKNNIEDMESSGYIVTSTFSEYYLNRVRGDFLIHQRPTPLPLTLSLTIYGISSIKPGDIFRVDYLPKNYRKLLYFQVMKVTHAIDSSGWYTTLETQFRFRSKMKIKSNLYFKPTNICISPKRIDELTKLQGMNAGSGRRKLEDISKLTPYMINIKFIDKSQYGPGIDFAFEFIATGRNTDSTGEIETGISYTLDFALTSKGHHDGGNGYLDVIREKSLYDDISKLYESNMITDKSVNSFEPIVEGGLSFYYLNPDNTDRIDIIVPLIRPIKLIKNKKYHLLVKDHKWIVYTPGTEIIRNPPLKTLNSNDVRSLVIRLLNVTDEIKPQKFECDRCVPNYESYSKNGKVIHDFTIEEQKFICENEIGGEDTNYCIWEDTFFGGGIVNQTNACKPNPNTCN